MVFQDPVTNTEFLQSVFNSLRAVNKELYGYKFGNFGDGL